MSGGNVAAEAFSTVVLLRAGGAAPPLFFIHGVGGVLPQLQTLLDRLDPEHPVYAIRSQAFDPHSPTLLRLEEMAACYLADVRKTVADGPIGLVGFSFGGMVAFEMAQQMLSAGCVPPALFMLDSMDMSRSKREAQVSPATHRALDLAARLRRRFQEAFAEPDSLAYIRDKFTARAHRAFYSITARLHMPFRHSVHNPSHVNWFAAVNYVPRPYPERFYLFKAKDHYWEPRTPYDLGWGPWAPGGVKVFEIPGNHTSLFKEPNVSILAGHLAECLKAVCAGESRVA